MVQNVGACYFERFNFSTGLDNVDEKLPTRAIRVDLDEAFFDGDWLGRQIALVGLDVDETVFAQGGETDAEFVSFFIV